MKPQTGNYLKLGLMVTVSLILLVVAVYLIGSRQNIFGETFQISAVFKNVNGLQSGNNVRFAGINVGTVDQIVIITDSTVEVNMKINSNVQRFIKKDAFASIGSDGLVGNMLVNISPGSGDMPSVEHLDRIASFSRTDTDDILSTLSSTNENIAILSRDLLDITQQISHGQGTITALLKDTNMVNSFSHSLSNLEMLSAKTINIANNLERFSKKFDNNHNLLNLILYDSTITNQIKQVVVQLYQTSENLHQVSIELKQTTDVLAEGNGNGPINTLLYDSTAANELKESITNIRDGTVLLNENLEAMRHHFLFRKYFKDQEKNKEK